MSRASLSMRVLRSKSLLVLAVSEGDAFTCNQAICHAAQPYEEHIHEIHAGQRKEGLMLGDDAPR
jgi:hypothetical protein